MDINHSHESAILSRAPSIAVVIPMYNGVAFIGRAIGSVYQQTVKATEILVVDDGSTDSSHHLIRRLFPEVTVITQSNMGVGCARNTGIAAAQSEWIAFLDADDFWLANHLEVACNLIHQFPEASILSTGHRRWDSVSALMIKNKNIETGIVNYFEAQISNSELISSSSTVIARSAFSTVGGFGKQKIHEDTDMWERLALSFPFARTTEVTAIYVNTPGSATSQLHQDLTGSSINWDEILYLSNNIDTARAGSNTKSLQRYQNYLRWCNVKTLLLNEQFPLAKKKSLETEGTMLFSNRFGISIVAHSPQLILRVLIKLVRQVIQKS